ncbi:MAG: SDR family oxidoreductase [Planctomycetes bacterium]|nr:SDR family oxidoreductase [Planctomycetota bacterium]
MSLILVTGGAGFIGSHIGEALLNRGDTVRVLDDFSTGRRENIDTFADRIDLIEGDLRDNATLRRAVAGCEYVFHEAALPSVPRSVEDPQLSHDVNMNGTARLLVTCKECGVRRIVLASSSSVYGDAPGFPRREDQQLWPLSPYAAGKVALEAYARSFANVYDMETVCLRYFNIFGPRQNHKSQYAIAIPSFITRILSGQPPTVYGDGEQSRDFTYVENVVHANLLALTAKGASGEAFNVGCGGGISLNQIIALINKIVGTDIKPDYTAPRPGDVRRSQADIDKARSMLGYEPKVAFEAGLRRTIEWYRKNVIET